MRTYSCDRCGEFIGKNVSPFVNPTSLVATVDLDKNGVILTLPGPVEGGLEFLSKELCRPCAEALSEWMRQSR